MKHILQLYFFVFLFLFLNFPVFAQETQVISGTVLDASNGEPLPFASIGLKKQLIGIVTNEAGKFDLIVSTSAEDDTLIVIAFGFQQSSVAVKAINGPLVFRLKPAPIQLQEVEVIPLSPELYIRMAMRKVVNNYPSSPFESVAYYREKLLENKEFIRMDEGVFKTYCPNYLDTAKNQDQLLLFRTAENTKPVSFMSKEMKEKEDKEKNGEKIESKNVELDLTSSFGGPEDIFKSSKLNPKSSSYLDTNQLKDYKYVFAKSGAGDWLIIEFKSRGKVEHLRESGRIFIDPSSFAIVKIENSGDFIIPVLIRPILFFYRLGIENPTFVKNVEFQQVGDKWYPRNIQATIVLELTRRHWFSRNEHSTFEIEQNYVVNRLNVDQPSKISSDKRFNPSKKMKDQVHNDDNLRWENINIIKK